jgi:carotenoid cleavage dioxygenase-like enzyme
MILMKIIKAILNIFKKKSKSKNKKQSNKEPLLKTSREEFEGQLQAMEGALPNDLFGGFHVSYPVGSVNSGGLPFPEFKPDGKPNPEFGSPIMNGDGFIIQIDFDNPAGPHVKTKLMKTPCYYADEATKEGTKHHGLMGFHNMGITRMSMVLGGRNQLNTATQPVRFKNQTNGSMLATYDVGRPYVIDPKSLELVTPIGRASEWMTAQPPMVPWPFGLIQTSAHPVFDPLTQELFTVNYSKNKKSYTYLEQSIHHLKHNREKFKSKLEALADRLVEHESTEHVKSEVNHFFHHLNDHVDGKKHDSEEPKGDVFLNLLLWTGDGPLTQWTLSDQNGSKLAIYECMHQMGLTEDYLILTDCSFKFALDMLFDNPFPESKLIERLIRRLATVRMEPFTTTYIVKRKELTAGGGNATAYRLDKPIPLETIHYSCNYANPDGMITLLGIHNAATCIAEWVRTFDERALDGKPVDPDYYSLFAVGSMDISRIGKWKIDAENLKLLEDKSSVYWDAGKYEEENLGPNTWAISLYGYRGILSADEPVKEIKQMWFLTDGTVKNLLTKFIFNLYKDYEHRKIDDDLILKLTEKELPFGMTRLNIDTMQPEEYFQFDRNVFPRGVHFIPKKTPTPNVPLDLDGYLVSPVQVGNSTTNPTAYSSEFWIFEAGNISKGPICKLTHPKIKFAFTLHTSWIPEIKSSDQEFKISTKEDYQEVLKNLELGVDRKFLEEFFEQNVYPHFD